ncbi:MAG: hypothetical protein JWO78_795 [Micavibrio sp.]|nr:hypothetical protein [Micavibrio sp.]
MLDDKDLDRMLNTYRVPALDPDVVIQAVHNAVHQPVPFVEIAKLRRRFRLAIPPFPSFRMGGAVAAMILVIMPLTGLQTQPELNVDAVIDELVVSQQVAENDIRSAEEILGLIDSRRNSPPEGFKNTDDRDEEDAPIWDTFMGHS